MSIKIYEGQMLFVSTHLLLKRQISDQKFETFSRLPSTILELTRGQQPPPPVYRTPFLLLNDDLSHRLSKRKYITRLKGDKLVSDSLPKTLLDEHGALQNSIVTNLL